jgi:hypothetical protein
VIRVKSRPCRQGREAVHIWPLALTHPAQRRSADPCFIGHLAPGKAPAATLRVEREHEGVQIKESCPTAVASLQHAPKYAIIGVNLQQYT